MVTIGNRGRISLRIPYKLNFNTMAAKIILPPKGDSTCALSNQPFTKITGALIAKAIQIPKNKNNCVK
jgi:hypothetical protein